MAWFSRAEAVRLDPGKLYQRKEIEKALGPPPETTPLWRIYRSEAVQQALADYEQRDAAAGLAQVRFKRAGHVMLQASTAGAVIGALLLLPQWLVDWLPAGAVGAAQTLALLVATVSAWWIAASRRVDRWMGARAEAEELRGDLFRAFMNAPPPPGADAKAALRGKLDLVQAAYIDDQLRFFDRRSRENEAAAGRWTPLRLLGYLLFTLVAALAVPLIGRTLSWAGFAIWPWLAQVTDWLLTHDADRWRLAAATIASSLLGHASARSSLDQNARTAALYRATAARVRRRMADSRAAAEAAADRGDEAVVRGYLDDVRRVLEAEHFAWFTAKPEVHPIAGSGNGAG